MFTELIKQNTELAKDVNNYKKNKDIKVQERKKVSKETFKDDEGGVIDPKSLNILSRID